MDNEKIKQFIQLGQELDLLPEAQKPRAGPKSNRKPKMEFSKKILLGALFFYGALCVVSLASWFLTGDWPQQIIEHFLWPIIAIVSYLAKSAYENKAKIQGGGEP